METVSRLSRRHVEPAWGWSRSAPSKVKLGVFAGELLARID